MYAGMWWEVGVQQRENVVFLCVCVCVATDCSAGAVMVMVVRETPQPVPSEVSLCGCVMRRPAS